LPPGAPVPPFEGDFFSVTKTPEELSIVCEPRFAPASDKIEAPYRALKLEGPLDFSLVGVLSPILQVLSVNHISVFTLSTYDTDYILVREEKLEAAVRALEEAGYRILGL